MVKYSSSNPIRLVWRLPLWRSPRSFWRWISQCQRPRRSWRMQDLWETSPSGVVRCSHLVIIPRGSGKMPFVKQSNLVVFGQTCGVDFCSAKNRGSRQSHCCGGSPIRIKYSWAACWESIIHRMMIPRSFVIFFSPSWRWNPWPFFWCFWVLIFLTGLRLFLSLYLLGSFHCNNAFNSPFRWICRI